MSISMVNNYISQNNKIIIKVHIENLVVKQG